MKPVYFSLRNKIKNITNNLNSVPSVTLVNGVEVLRDLGGRFLGCSGVPVMKYSVPIHPVTFLIHVGKYNHYTWVIRKVIGLFLQKMHYI